MSEHDGEVVARGRIRVDARKAVDKLRDHMLVDPHLYACELARVAVAGGATRLDVIDEERAISFLFAGTLPAAEVVRARDEVLSGDTPELHPLRCLGIAISAALSLDLDVEVLSDGTSTRFTGATSAPRSTPTTTPPGLVRVVVRSGGLGVALGRVIGAAPRRELALLHAAVAGGPLALTVNGALLRVPAEAFVLRLPIDEPDATLCVLDVLDGPTTSPEIVFRENGVVLRTYPLLFARIGTESLPLRVIVDAPRLPTNASRSEVRFDGGLAERVLRSAEAMLDGVVTALEVKGTDALAAFAIAAARAGAAGDARVKRLLALPLLDNAFGLPLSIGGLLVRRPVLVYSGREPLPKTLAPVLGSGRGVIVWKHGRPAERILDGLVAAPADDVVAQAVVGAERRARALEHPPTPPRLEDGRAWKVRQTFAIDAGIFSRLEGEIGMASDGMVPSARVFVDERFLETVPLPGVKLPIEVALAWPHRFAATLAYDAVERGSSLTMAIHHAIRIAALAIAEQVTDDPELVRLATVAWGSSSRTPAGNDALGAVQIAAFASAPIWPLAHGGMTTLADLDRSARANGGALYVAPATADTAGEERPVLHEAYARLVGAVLDDVLVVPYGRFPAPPRTTSGFTPALPRPIVMPPVRPLPLAVEPEPADPPPAPPKKKTKRKKRPAPVAVVAPVEAPSWTEGPSPSFFDGLVRRARALFAPKPDVFGTSPLTDALAAAISGLALTGRPVDSVVEGTRGRPLRYEPATKRIVVNVRHRSVARLVDDPHRLTHLLLAAASEINRELVAVTDAEEIEILNGLLRANER